ncbi:pyridine nucleotide-disulfide oxidoreductase domain-containing protein 2 isoform X2 [Opisthocomus hoazin]|uniref:pyridine nucleotide-disulfide oxidoreductase domain-containing protein 2 isoform X2 n=1 Tax=Opisthocomus hoazin TaxID=30419 RepID=UPI003F537861
MAGHCGVLAAGLRARLGMGSPSRWLRGQGPSLGLPGARLAHAGAADRLQREYDAVVIGAGHNGLVAAAYLQRAGVRTAVLEKRHVLGGAAVTEEIVPGFKFSRASYLLSLLRPQIYAELELQRHGLRVLPRDPYSFTPLLEDRSPPRSLLLGHDTAQTQRQIAQFSRKDAEAYPKYEAFMGGLVSALDPLLDAVPVDTAALGRGSLLQRLRALQALQPLLQAGLALGRQLPRYYEVLTAPISKILDQWFESEPLKATLATDAVIGAMASPHTPGSGYVLLHHVMGELQGRRGAWGYVAGGMGALSQAIARAAAAQGAHIFAEKAVCHVLLGRDGRAQGIALQDGTEVRSKLVLSNASPQITFLELTPQEQLPKDFVQRIRQVDTCSPVTKINVAVDRLPSFLAAPNAHDGQPLPHHQCSIHLNCEGTHLLHQAFTEVTHGHPSSRVQGVRHRQGHPDATRPGEDLWAAGWEHLPWSDVSGPAVLCPASTILLRLPVPSSWLVPVWKRSPPWRRSDGSSRTQRRPCGPGGLQTPMMAVVTPTSPAQGCGCNELCCPHAEPCPSPTCFPGTTGQQHPPRAGGCSLTGFLVLPAATITLNAWLLPAHHLGQVAPGHRAAMTNLAQVHWWK